MPTWDGELYLEYHRGTYTSQARNKKNNRKTELKLREAEWLASEAAVKTGDFSSYPAKELPRGLENRPQKSVPRHHPRFLHP